MRPDEFHIFDSSELRLSDGFTNILFPKFSPFINANTDFLF